ncbi:universal stress protein [Streptomyces sp. NPDC049555]|uniref:universal stress protein n=1 Tax=Streptomyces sp. NPDC049555 TaxID=3154930 RepID=UPI00341D255E
MSGPVLVDVTRAAVSPHAVAWAADEAAWRGLPLHLVHAQEWPTGKPPRGGPGQEPPSWVTHFRATGEALLQDALETALMRHRGLELVPSLVAGRRVHVLREAAESAGMLVLGARRYTGVDTLFTPGDKSDALIGHLACPVVLVPEPTAGLPADAPVVVGVDGSPASDLAVALAFEEAALAGTGLVAVDVRRPRDAELPEFLDASRLVLSEALAGHCAQYPEVQVRREVLTGDPAGMLASAARRARCLVVGARGRGGFRGMLAGSTSRTLAHRTECPLIVAPPPQAPGHG